MEKEIEKNDQLISLNSLTKTYNKGKENQFQALKGIDLTIDKGEFVAIIGASGSGKSTLMQILGALDVASSGDYYLHNKNIEEYTEDQLSEFRNKEIGFVFQQFNLLPKYTLLENVKLPSLYGEIDNPNSKAQELLEKVGLGHKLNSKPNQISGGQVQRVAIARSLMMNPSIILADEPTGNLDTQTGKEIMEIFSQINREGNTVIVITHEQEIANYASRIIRIQDGLIVSDILNHNSKSKTNSTYVTY
ncbi:MAG: ABC transporter ATP-binding protein [Patescibacteria group bacterium]